MRGVVIGALVLAAVAFRVWRWRRRRAPASAASPPTTTAPRAPAQHGGTRAPGPVAMVARREIRERVRGRIFRVGTVIVLLVVVGAIVIPSLHGKAGPSVQRVGVVGPISATASAALRVVAEENGDVARLHRVTSLVAAERELRSGSLDVVVLDQSQLLLAQPVSSKSSTADPGFVAGAARALGVLAAYEAARLSPRQASIVEGAGSVPVTSLSSGGSPTKPASIIGLVLLFFMLSQYNTWILIGVMQEKSSRVVEVLLATVRPIQLLAGKVLGIGAVALGQAALVVGVALGAGAAVGSDVLKGTAPLVLACQLLWLVLGYAFYCWVYAAAGSTAERQDQVQTLALPLSIPILVAYIFSITVASTGNPDAIFKVLAYLPPTAPFCMPVLVSLSDVTWWQFLASVAITLVATVGAARLAARIYQRAILRTRGRVRLGELLAFARQ